MKELHQRITNIYPTQDEAVKTWEALVEDWYMFMWEWEYVKWLLTIKLWYDEELPSIARKEEFYEKIGAKKAKKLK
jgi:hypothetical protein